MSFSGLFIIIGGVLVASGLFAFFRQRARMRRSRLTTGTIVELVPYRKSGEYLWEKSTDGVKIKPKYLYQPVVRFKTETGRSMKFMVSIASRPKPYQVGEQVKVIYDPDNPQKAQINRFLYLWFNVLMLLFFGVFTLAMGLLGVMMAGL